MPKYFLAATFHHRRIDSGLSGLATLGNLGRQNHHNICVQPYRMLWLPASGYRSSRDISFFHRRLAGLSRVGLVRSGRRLYTWRGFWVCAYGCSSSSADEWRTLGWSCGYRGCCRLCGRIPVLREYVLLRGACG